MLRYKKYTGVRKNVDGKRQYSTVRYPKIPEKTSDIYIYTKALSRVDLIAHAYYGDVSLWPIIARANNVAKGTMFIRPGTRLRIPYPLNMSEVEELFNDINEL